MLHIELRAKRRIHHYCYIEITYVLLVWILVQPALLVGMVRKKHTLYHVLLINISYVVKY